jgi:hypothetical protein
MICLKFVAPKPNKEESKPNKVKDFLVNSAIGILKKIIPEANPDYEDKIDSVKTWLVEFEEETNLPNREIGLDSQENVIMIMPDDINYGYWTDNNLKKEDFENQFDTEEIENKYFDKLWKKFEKRKKY